MPATHLVANRSEAAVRMVIDSSTADAMTGVMAFSSKEPPAPLQATVASRPTTSAQTITTISGITGFTLPGISEQPGCRSGKWSSARPAVGPEASQRTSFAILVNEMASERKGGGEGGGGGGRGGR